MKKCTLAERMTFKGAQTSNDDLVQPDSEWIDTNGFDHAVISSEVLACSACTLVAETSVMRDGPWTALVTHTQTEETVTIADTLGSASNKLQRYLRWRIERTSAVNWETCFRFTVTLK